MDFLLFSKVENLLYFYKMTISQSQSGCFSWLVVEVKSSIICSCDNWIFPYIKSLNIHCRLRALDILSSHIVCKCDSDLNEKNTRSYWIFWIADAKFKNISQSNIEQNINPRIFHPRLNTKKSFIVLLNTLQYFIKKHIIVSISNQT